MREVTGGCVFNNAAKHAAYMRDYMKRRRAAKKARGTCTTCAVREARPGLATCTICAQRKALQYEREQVAEDIRRLLGEE